MSLTGDWDRLEIFVLSLEMAFGDNKLGTLFHIYMIKAGFGWADLRPAHNKWVVGIDMGFYEEEDKTEMSRC